MNKKNSRFVFYENIDCSEKILRLVQNKEIPFADDWLTIHPKIKISRPYIYSSIEPTNFIQKMINKIDNYLLLIKKKIKKHY